MTSFCDSSDIKLAAWNNLLRKSSDVFYVKDDQLRYIDASQSFAVLQGFDKVSDLIGKTDEDFIASPTLLELYIVSDRAILSTGKTLRTKPQPVKAPDGTTRYYTSEVSPLKDGDGQTIGIFGTMLDVTSEYLTKRERDELARVAEQDPMTGLLNHDAGFTHMREFLKGEGVPGMHALFMMDIDDFKCVNDTMGHQQGDKVIRNFADTLQHSFRQDDIVCRVGGDEFMALMKNVKTRDAIVRKARELLQVLQRTYRTDGGVLELTSSIGIAVYNGDGTPLHDLYHEADTQLYEAKEAGKNRFSIGGLQPKDETAMLPASTGDTAVHVHSLIENIDGFIALCEIENGKLRFTYTSPTVFRSTRRSADEIGTHGEHLTRFVVDEDRPALERALLETGLNGTPLDHVYRIMIPLEACPRWRHARGSRLPSEDDGVDRVLVIVQDSTASGMATMEMRVAYAIADMALESTRATIWRYDCRTRTATQQGSTKGGSARIYENLPESIVDEGRLAEESVDAFNDLLEKTDAGVEDAEGVICFRSPDGMLARCLVRIRNIFEDDGEPVCAIISVTEMGMNGK